MEANLYKNQSSNNVKTFFLMTTFLVVIIVIGWWLSYYFGAVEILYGAVGLSIFMNIWAYWFSDKLVLNMAHAKEVTREEYFDLYNGVENLAITAGLPLPKIYVINDPVPNAFATGRDKNHAAVAFTTGLLDILDKSELEGVIAHELAHIGNKDILLQTVVVVLVGIVTLISDFFLRSAMYGGNDRGKSGGFVLVIGLVLTILAPIIATLLKLAISRKREFAADSTGALLTRYPEGLASALEKIHAHAATMKTANHAIAHLYIANPFRGKKNAKSYFNKLFMTHPPVDERLSALRG